jgi:diguanylate cyclase (GGDEF)-like protein
MERRVDRRTGVNGMNEDSGSPQTSKLLVQSCGVVLWGAAAGAWLASFPPTPEIDWVDTSVKALLLVLVAACYVLVARLGNWVLLAGAALYGLAVTMDLLGAFTQVPRFWEVTVQALVEIGALLVVAVGAAVAWRRHQARLRQADEVQQQLYHLAHHDILTDLPNRNLFSDRLEQALARSRRDEEAVAVHFIDIDDFKKVNDSYGHDVGDDLIRQLAERLRQSVRETDTVSRWGGDEFVIVQGGLKNREGVQILVRKIIKAAEKPVVLAGVEYQPQVSVGTALFPDDTDDADVLLNFADAAMYEAKQRGGTHHQMYHAQLAVVPGQYRRRGSPGRTT